MKVFTSSLDEVFAKLLFSPEDEVLHERAEVSLALGEFAQESLSQFEDEYIGNVQKTIESYSERYHHLKTAILKSGHALEHACASSYTSQKMPEQREILRI